MKGRKRADCFRSVAGLREKNTKKILTSRGSSYIIVKYSESRSGGIGRRSGLKIRRRQKRVGSSPTFGIFYPHSLAVRVFLFVFLEDKMRIKIDVLPIKRAEKKYKILRPAARNCWPLFFMRP